MDQEHLNAAAADFIQSIGLLVRRVRAASSGQDFSLTQAAVMTRLDKGGPATISDMARAEGMKPQSMGAIVAGLEEMGLVERKAHPTDGRQVNIELSAKGVSARKSTRDAKIAWVARGIAGLDEEEQETLFAAGEIIKRLVEL